MKSSKLILKMIAICFAVVAIPVLTAAQSVVPPTPIYSMSGLVGIHPRRDCGNPFHQRRAIHSKRSVVFP
jgi:hypothetical protein